MTLYIHVHVRVYKIHNVHMYMYMYIQLCCVFHNDYNYKENVLKHFQYAFY